MKRTDDPRQLDMFDADELGLVPGPFDDPLRLLFMRPKRKRKNSEKPVQLEMFDAADQDHQA